MTTQILKSCDTAWIIVNHGIPKLSTLRGTRTDCIQHFRRDMEMDDKDWQDAKQSGQFVCVKVQLVPK